MDRIKLYLCKLFPVACIIFSLVWLSNLASTDSYFSVYVLIAFLSLYLQVKNESASVSCTVRIGSVLLSVLFSGAVVLANYPLFTTIGDPAVIGRGTSILMNLINGLLTFVGGTFVGYPLIRFVFESLPFDSFNSRSFKWEKYLSWFFFFTIAGLHLFHLFLVEFPGNVTEDPFTQISEMISGQYTNFNTFWHTMIFQGVLALGYGIFSDVNSAVAFYCVLQALVMAFAFTYCLMTIRAYGVSGCLLLCFYLIYAILPYNMALSITVWKDVLYAGGCLLVLSSVLRIRKNIGKPCVNYPVFVFGSLLFILARTNGWIIYLISALIFFVFSRKKRTLPVIMCVFGLLGWFLLNPALSILNVPGGDPVESMSIPIQQVSRVIADGCELTQEEEELLSYIVDLDEVPELYQNWISDPMKVEIRSKDYAYFLDNLSQYRDLWIRLGVRYPFEYLKAWVDQTKGYWNGGYDYFLYSETITDNPYGVEKTGGGTVIASLFHLYFGLSRHLIFFEPLHSIGLHIWIVILCFLSNAVKRREEFIISVPLLLLVIGLWFGTPVYCSFRYVYPLFVSFPLVLSTALWQHRKS